MEDNNITTVDEEKDEFENICYLCHRPESVTGKMITLRNFREFREYIL